MSASSAAPEQPETIDPRLLLMPASDDMVPAPQAEQPSDDSPSPQEEDDPFMFPTVSPGGSPMNLDLGGPEPAATIAVPEPPGPSPVSTPGKPLYLFGEYACYLPRFDLDKLADGMYERDRTFPPPANDDVEAVTADPEHFVKLVRVAISSKPDHPSNFENHMSAMFINSMVRIDNRDIVITQIAAEVVRSVIKLHEPSAVGETRAEGLVEGADGNYVEGRVDVARQPDVIGGHLRPDVIEDIALDPRDYRLTATARIDIICKILMQTKALTYDAFCGKDTIAHIVAAPYKKQSEKYPPGQQATQP